MSPWQRRRLNPGPPEIPTLLTPSWFCLLPRHLSLLAWGGYLLSTSLPVPCRPHPLGLEEGRGEDSACSSHLGPDQKLACSPTTPMGDRTVILWHRSRLAAVGHPHLPKHRGACRGANGYTVTSLGLTPQCLSYRNQLRHDSLCKSEKWLGRQLCGGQRGWRGGSENPACVGA